MYLNTFFSNEFMILRLPATCLPPDKSVFFKCHKFPSTSVVSGTDLRAAALIACLHMGTEM